MVTKDELNATEKKMNKRIDDLEKKLRKEYEEKIKEKGDELELQLKQKDDEIVQLKQQIQSLAQQTPNELNEVFKKELGDLKKSCNFLSTETTNLKGSINENKLHINNETKHIKDIQDKTRDMEDRQRRDNLIFFNVKETDNTEDCERLVMNELVKCGIFEQCDVQDRLTERAHRLGKPKRDSDRPRPIIVKMSSHRDKQHILSNARKLARSEMNVNEDFSKPTLELHTQLYKAAKSAKEKGDSNMRSFRVLYRRLSVKFEDSITKQEYFRTFTMRDITDNPATWYKQRN